MKSTVGLEASGGTMIRHGCSEGFSTIFPLSVEVCQSATIGTLVAAICRAPLPKPLFLTAALAAIAVAPITALTDEEKSPATESSTEPGTQTFLGDLVRHLNLQAVII